MAKLYIDKKNKKIYSEEAYINRLKSGEIKPTTQSAFDLAMTKPKGKGIIQGIKEFFTGEVTGETQEMKGGVRGLAGSIAQETYGSKGVLGALQLPGKTIATAISYGDIEKTAKAQDQLTKSVLDTIGKAKKYPKGSNMYNKLMDSAKKLMSQNTQFEEAKTELGKHTITPGQALATTTRAEMTLAAPLISKAFKGVETALGLRAGVDAVTGQIIKGTALKGSQLFGARVLAGGTEAAIASIPYATATALEKGQSPKEAADTYKQYAGTAFVLGSVFRGLGEGYNTLKQKWNTRSLDKVIETAKSPAPNAENKQIATMTGRKVYIDNYNNVHIEDNERSKFIESYLKENNILEPGMSPDEVYGALNGAEFKNIQTKVIPNLDKTPGSWDIDKFTKNYVTDYFKRRMGPTGPYASKSLSAKQYEDTTYALLDYIRTQAGGKATDRASEYIIRSNLDEGMKQIVPNLQSKFTGQKLDAAFTAYDDLREALNKDIKLNWKGTPGGYEESMKIVSGLISAKGNVLGWEKITKVPQPVVARMVDWLERRWPNLVGYPLIAAGWYALWNKLIRQKVTKFLGEVMGD